MRAIPAPKRGRGRRSIPAPAWKENTPPQPLPLERYTMFHIAPRPNGSLQEEPMGLRPAALLFACSFLASAQSQSGTIVGTVTDQGGAVAPNALVTLTNQGTQFARSVPAK
jgi:hypothetical protein